MSRMLPRVAVWLFAAAGVTAQAGPFRPNTPGAQGVPQSPLQNQPQSDPLTTGLFPFGGQVFDPSSEDSMNPVWMTPSRQPFQGFPVFPSALKGYGNYPLPTDPNALGGAVPVLPPLLLPVEAEVPGWPAWARTQAKRPLPFAPELGLLVQHTDRVWWRAAGDEAFVPLFFHDKFQTLTAGGEVEVRQRGDFELLLHDSTKIAANGPTRLVITALDASHVAVALRQLTRIDIHAVGRQQAFVLPDGSELRIGAPAAADPTGAPALPQPCHVQLLRDDEPGWYGGRAVLQNLGERPVTWRHAFGEVTVAAGEQVRLFVTPPPTAIGAEFRSEGCEVAQQAGRAQCSATGDAEVRWCGASFTLPAGAQLELESLQGNGLGAPAGP